MSSKNIAKRAAVVTMSLIAVAGCERYALDQRMEELCKKDGGVHVYETVQLAPEMFDASGNPFPPRLRSEIAHKAGENRTISEELLISLYRRTWEVVYLKTGEPTKGEGVLARTSERVTRVSDGKLLGEAVSYSRIGGDFIAFPHFSSNRCPADQDNNDTTKAVFKLKRD